MSPRKTAAARAKAERTERRRRQTAGEIVEAALAVVLREGVAAFSLGAVAEELGLTTPAIYYYFDSKEQLLAELIVGELLEAASVIEAAVEPAKDGADAVERLMRAVFERYRDRLDLFSLAYKTTTLSELRILVRPEDLERTRPMNDMMYAGAAARLEADKKRGLFPKRRDARRFVFTAHMAVVGLLTIKAVTDPIGDPLVHSDDALIDDMCRTFRAAAHGRKTK